MSSFACPPSGAGMIWTVSSGPSSVTSIGGSGRTTPSSSSTSNQYVPSGRSSPSRESIVNPDEPLTVNVGASARSMESSKASVANAMLTA